MVELSGLEAKLRAINAGRRPAMALYLYGDPAYSTVYSIMGPYKNYPNYPRTAAYDRFNKAISRLRIEVEHGFAIHQNLWTWNSFHLGLRLQQGAVISYAVSVLLANAWTCMRGNQTSQRFGCMPPALEDYLSIPEDIDMDGEAEGRDAEMQRVEMQKIEMQRAEMHRVDMQGVEMQKVELRSVEVS